MILKAAILAILLELPVANSDHNELWEKRAQRLESVALAVTHAAFRATCGDLWANGHCAPIALDPIPVAASDMAIIEYESHLARRIQVGDCAKKDCDPKWVRLNGKRVLVHLARGLPQLHRQDGWSDWYWNRMIGTEQVDVDASIWEATFLFSRDLEKCGTLEGAMARYAKGTTCKWSGAAERAGMAREFEVRLRKLTEEP